MKHWLFLAIAIAAEVVATSSLKASEGFTRLLPSTVVVVGYAAAFYFLSLSLTLRAIPLGTAYAAWSGLGTVLVAMVGWAIFGQKLDAWSVAGMALIVTGVLMMNLLSKSAIH